MGNCSSDKSTETTSSVNASSSNKQQNAQPAQSAKTEATKTQETKTYTEKQLEMAKYKLVYFNIRGRAELIRLLFAEAGVEYEDERIEQEQWEQLKTGPKFLFAQLPILEIGDEAVLAQSKAIARFVARENGLYGSTILEGAYIDMIVDSMDDLLSTMYQAMFESDEERKETIMKNLKEVKGPLILGALEKILGKKKEMNKEYFVGDSVSLADFCFYAISDPITKLPDNPLQHFPNLTEHRNRIEGLPRVAAWLKKRPETAI